ncbi:hypothetical protein [Wolbachia pipientis]|uniref:hypothetical protein n=1 Tax=Wolbachia pipientis TaxID=955 RepID=UPI0025A3358A|nr:hypothetical protein [Wolbachia pipientis]MDM8334805.1 hypothetical protein [Wolbachia pipientis]
MLHIARDNTPKVFSNNNYQDLSKYQVYIECDKGVFKVTLELGASCSNPFYSSFNVLSITPYGRDTSYSELKKMENMLGLSKGKSPFTITQISKDPITVPKVAENGDVPSSATDVPVIERKHHINNLSLGGNGYY